MSAADREANTLRRLGVSFVAGVPGSGPSYELLDACERAGMPFLLTSHEAAGAIIAGTAARQAGGLGAALSIKGPGVANLLGGIALSRFENYPLITFSEAYAPDAPPGLQHKRMDQDAAIGALSKGVFYRGAELSLDALAALAWSEPSGPVHVNLVESVVPAAGPVADRVSAALDHVLEHIAASRRPVVICGSAATRVSRQSVQRAEIPDLHVPVFTTAAAKGALDERSPASAGVYTGAGQSLAPERRLLPQADLVIGIGLRNVEVLGARPFPAPYVSVDSADDSFQRGFDAVAHCSTDLGSGIDQIVAALQGHRWGLDEVDAARQAMAAHLDRDELLPGGCYDTLARVPDARLVTDSGNFTIVAEHVWRAGVPADFVGSSNGRFMGAGLPQAIGVCLENGTRPTICTLGDGGLPPFIAELRIAVERRLPLLLVLMSDGHYGSMRARVLERGYTDSGVRVSQPSWQRVIAAMGCETVRVDDRRAFDAAVSAWRPAVGPLFIEAVMPDLAYLDMVKPLRG
jgi:acetolactate synthase-1/2/3 large subunit